MGTTYFSSTLHCMHSYSAPLLHAAATESTAVVKKEEHLSRCPTHVTPSSFRVKKCDQLTRHGRDGQQGWREGDHATHKHEGSQACSQRVTLPHASRVDCGQKHLPNPPGSFCGYRSSACVTPSVQTTRRGRQSHLPDTLQHGERSRWHPILVS